MLVVRRSQGLKDANRLSSCPAPKHHQMQIVKHLTLVLTSGLFVEYHVCPLSPPVKGGD